MHLAATILSSLALIVPGDRATASFRSGTLTLTLHYLMTCGQPGPGPLVVRLPTAFSITDLHAYVRDEERPDAVNDSAVTIDLPDPPAVTCMSITEGTLPVRLVGVHAPRGIWTVRARIRSHAFAARLRIPVTLPS